MTGDTTIDAMIVSAIALLALATGGSILRGRMLRSSGRTTGAGLIGAASLVLLIVGAATAFAAGQGSSEASPGDYALVLQTITINHQAGAAFHAAMRDGRMTEAEFWRIRRSAPIGTTADERQIAVRVARDMGGRP